jgi:hypothetical protein
LKNETERLLDRSVHVKHPFSLAHGQPSCAPLRLAENRALRDCGNC